MMMMMMTTKIKYRRQNVEQDYGKKIEADTRKISMKCIIANRIDDALIYFSAAMATIVSLFLPPFKCSMAETSLD